MSNFFPDSGESSSDRGYRVPRIVPVSSNFAPICLFLRHPVKIKKMSLSNRCIDVRNFERETLGRFWTRVRISERVLERKKIGEKKLGQSRSDKIINSCKKHFLEHRMYIFRRPINSFIDQIRSSKLG